MLKVFPSSQVALSLHGECFKGGCTFVNLFPTCYITFEIKSNTIQYFRVLPYRAVIPPSGSVYISFQMNRQIDQDCDREIIKHQKFLVQYAVRDGQSELIREGQPSVRQIPQSRMQTHKLYVRLTSRRESILVAPQMREITKQIIPFMPPDTGKTFEHLSREVEKLEEEKSELVKRGKRTKEGGVGLLIMILVLIIMLILGLNHLVKKEVKQDYSYFSLDSFWEANEKHEWRWF